MSINLSAFAAEARRTNRVLDTYCDLYNVIGLLQGYACVLGAIDLPDLEVMIDGLKECSQILEQVGATFRAEYDDCN